MRRKRLKRTQLYISEEDHRKLQYYSSIESKSMSGEVREAIKQYLAKKDLEVNQKIKGAKKDSIFNIIGMCKDTEENKQGLKDYKKDIYKLPWKDNKRK